MDRALRISLLILALAAPAAQAGEPPPVEQAAIVEVLTESARAWNRGDLDGFLALSYERSPETVFVGGDGFVTGYDAIAKRYRDRYGSSKNGLGTLSFDRLTMRQIGPDYAIVYGGFHLVPDDQKAPASGVFDLIFHKSPEGWRIVSDHTS